MEKIRQKNVIVFSTPTWRLVPEVEELSSHTMACVSRISMFPRNADAARDMMKKSGQQGVPADLDRQ